MTDKYGNPYTNHVYRDNNGIVVSGGKQFVLGNMRIVASWDNGRYNGDFYRLTETLYRTTKGAFLLEGEGYYHGWGHTSGSGVSYGAGYVPFSDAEAMRWLQDHDCHTELLELFGDKISEA